MSPENPNVSVVIPTYNSSQFIAETLESVFKQTYKDYEVIVVDDGSTDNTKETLEPYISRIRYIYKENGGPASARNVGIKNAKGDYIAFLDSDDLWVPEKLEKQMDYFQSNADVDLVYSDCIRFPEQDNRRKSDKVRRSTSGYIFFELLCGNFIPNSSVVVKKKCFDKVGYLDEDIKIMSSEDYDMWLRISEYFPVGYIKEPLMKYRVRNSGVSRSNIGRAYNAQIITLKKAIEGVEDKNIKKRISRNCFFKLYFNWGLSLLDVENFSGAKAAFFKAIKIKPHNVRNFAYYLLSVLRTFLNR